MSTLEAVDRYPGDLLRGPRLDIDTRRWWALYTKSRQEKALARDLRAQGIPFYLPQTYRTTVYRGRRRTSVVALFPGYLFLFGDNDDRYRSLKTNRVVQSLTVSNQDDVFRSLLAVDLIIRSGEPFTVESRLMAGDLVRVRSGPFEGVEGTVVSRFRRSRIIVAVRLIQQGVSLEVDDFQLERIDR